MSNQTQTLKQPFECLSQSEDQPKSLPKSESLIEDIQIYCR